MIPSFDGKVREPFPVDMFVVLDSCPPGNGHVGVQKVVYRPSLEVFHFLEVPIADYGDMVSQWCDLQAARPELLVAICDKYWKPSSRTVCILREHMPLGSLDELLQACGGLPEDALRDIALAVLEALNTIHSAEPPMVHGDLTPSQVLFTANGRPKISFGLQEWLRSCQVSATATNVNDVPAFEDSSRAASSDHSTFVRPASGKSTAADIADVGYLMLASALGGVDVLLEAMPHARKMDTLAIRASPDRPLYDTCDLLQQELSHTVADTARCEKSSGLPITAHLLFNRRYSRAFHTFVTACLEAGGCTTHVSAKSLLDHEFLRPSCPRMAPFVSLHEMHECARLLTEIPEQAGSTMSQQYTVFTSVRHRAAVYLGRVAEAVAAHYSWPGTDAAACDSHTTVQIHASVCQGACEELLLDTARTLGLSRSEVQRQLEAHLECRMPEASVGQSGG
eukprot:NODE_4482_length_1886_cov_6.006254.p1 GENE.NODE_4482_length_1886_cov_6.006254~~NODE_4482_length_1886_cov_6.006254.p1  ORF type:complete len:452 (-),score=25.29 NODE_4482_length_1886_cov_6.006254:381-1736(-)